MTLFSCSLVLFGVAMLASAALRSLQDDVSLSYSIIDRLLAGHAAKAALHDAASTLTMIPKNLPIGQAQGAHHLGDITGERFVQGGPMQSCALPEYFLEMLPQPPSADSMQAEASSPHRYRITAKGKGLSETTTVVLQAEFETQTCTLEKNNATKDVQNGRQNGRQNSEQRSGQGSVQHDEARSEQPDAECIPHVRRLAWRVLHTS
jgi:Tfp pilus assembly protein PilX